MRTTPFYRAVMLDIERRRIELGITMLDMDDLAGTQSGYYGKCQAVDSPSGRQARWETIDLFVEVLFPGGADVRLAGREGGELDAPSYRRKIQFAAAMAGKRPMRDVMRDLGLKGRASQIEQQSPAKRKRIARKAGKASAKARRLKRMMDAEGCVISDREMACGQEKRPNSSNATGRGKLIA